MVETHRILKQLLRERLETDSLRAYDTIFSDKINRIAWEVSMLPYRPRLERFLAVSLRLDSARSWTGLTSS